jgi:gentisate 1,2-dioxygenase
VSKPHGWGGARFRNGGVVPYRSLDAQREAYPLLRFPWVDVKRALSELAAVTSRDEAVQLAYVNPETGCECLPTLGFSALALRPGEELRMPRRSASAVLHVVEGAGSASIDDASFAFGESDTLAVPTHADVRLINASGTTTAYLFVVDDAPLQRKLGIYEVFEPEPR